MVGSSIAAALPSFSIDMESYFFLWIFMAGGRIISVIKYPSLEQGTPS